MKYSILMIIAIFTWSPITLSNQPLKSNAITKLNSQIRLLESGTALPRLDISWSKLHTQTSTWDLKLQYAQSGFGDIDYSPSEILTNDISGYRRGIISGAAKKVVSMVGLIQSKIPLQIDELRLSKKDYEDHIELIIIVRGSTK